MKGFKFTFLNIKQEAYYTVSKTYAELINMNNEKRMIIK